MVCFSLCSLRKSRVLWTHKITSSVYTGKLVLFSNTKGRQAPLCKANGTVSCSQWCHSFHTSSFRREEARAKRSREVTPASGLGYNHVLAPLKKHSCPEQQRMIHRIRRTPVHSTGQSEHVRKLLAALRLLLPLGRHSTPCHAVIQMATYISTYSQGISALLVMERLCW